MQPVSEESQCRISLVGAEHFRSLFSGIPVVFHVAVTIIVTGAFSDGYSQQWDATSQQVWEKNEGKGLGLSAHVS